MKPLAYLVTAANGDIRVTLSSKAANKYATNFNGGITELIAKPVPLIEDEMRANFEAWIKERFGVENIQRRNNAKADYTSGRIFYAWQAWQAAYKSMNEDK